MIDYEARAKLAQQRKDDALMQTIGEMISKSLDENNKELKKNFTEGGENQMQLTKAMVQRFDVQIMMLMQIHKDLQALIKKKK